MTNSQQAIVEHRLDAEGADHLLLAGVNDANMQELARHYGIRVILRGDHLILSGEVARLERAVPLVQHLIELARLRSPFDTRDITRLAREFETRGEEAGRTATEGPRIALPGIRKVISPRSEGQRRYLRAISEHDVVISIGPAGTGKTYLAVAAAVEALYRKRVRRIILARPAVEAGENLGFLPGDLQEKVDPYLRPLYDSLEDMMPPERMARALEDRTIEIAPLAYMRGRTLSDAFVILDEAQNATSAQMKMFLTRLGLNSQVVITGDKTQIDLPPAQRSGLLEVERILQGIGGIEFIYLDGMDVIRHHLVKDIIQAYADADRAEEVASGAVDGGSGEADDALGAGGARSREAGPDGAPPRGPGSVRPTPEDTG